MNRAWRIWHRGWLRKAVTVFSFGWYPAQDAVPYVLSADVEIRLLALRNVAMRLASSNDLSIRVASNVTDATMRLLALLDLPVRHLALLDLPVRLTTGVVDMPMRLSLQGDAAMRLIAVYDVSVRSIANDGRSTRLAASGDLPAPVTIDVVDVEL